MIKNGQLNWKDLVGVLLLFLTEGETIESFNEYHGCACGEHYNWNVTTHKILKAGFYWPTLFSDIYRLGRICKKCQIFAEKKRLAPLSLILVFIEEPFRKWGLDFIGEINPPSSGQHKLILTTTNYFTKWVESIPTKKATDIVVIKFLEENIFARFGYPRKFVRDNSQVFKSAKLINLFQN